MYPTCRLIPLFIKWDGVCAVNTGDHVAGTGAVG